MGIRLFISYSSKDEIHRENLGKHLSLMERKGEIESWSCRKIPPGKEWEKEISENLESADVIVLLVSPDFMQSDYCFDIEVKRAMEKHESKNSVVLPVIVRACDWKDGTPFSKLQALPEPADPIKKWNDEDEAWLSVVSGIKKVAKNVEAKKFVQPIQEKGVSLMLQKDLKDWLEDTEIPFLHRRVDKISLSDIYVSPHLKVLNKQDDLTQLLDANGVLELSENLLVFGDEQSGKTSLAKHLFKLFLKRGCLPVFLDGKHIKSSDINKVIHKAIAVQYEDVDISNLGQIPNKILVLDNFSKIKLNKKHKNIFVSECKNFFDRCIYMALDAFRYVALEIYEINDFKRLEILPFGHVKRSEILERWVSLGIEEQIKEDELYSKVDELKLRLDSLVRENVIPAKPVHVLAIMQRFEVYPQDDLRLTSYGHCYQYLVYQALEKADIKPAEIDKYLNVLNELAWSVYKNESGLTSEDIDRFFVGYGEIYSLKTVEKTLVVDKLKSSGLLHTKDGLLSFKYPYIHYFFIARKIAESFNTDDQAKCEAKDEIKNLLSKLHRKINANIIIFISHHIKDKWILDEIQKCIVEVFSDQEEATLSSDSLLFMDEFIKGIPSLVLEYREVSRERRQRDKMIDEAEMIDAKTEESDIEYSDIVVRIEKVFKGIEIIGQILRNRHASIHKGVLFQMVQSATNAGLRFLQHFIEVSEVFQGEVIKAIQERVEKKPDAQTRDLEKRARNAFLSLTYEIILGVLGNISASIGSKEADEIYDELEKTHTNSRNPTY